MVNKIACVMATGIAYANVDDDTDHHSISKA